MLPRIEKSTEFIKEDLELMKRNEEEILDLEHGVLNKFVVVLSKEDELMISQLKQKHKNKENQNQLLDKHVKIQNDIEEIKNIAIKNNENENTKRKRSNSFYDIHPKKDTFEEDKRSGKRRRR
jgi:hypothetical protein